MNKSVVLYTTGCPKCRVLSKKLDGKNVEYEVCDSVDEMLKLGLTEAPALGVDDKILNYHDAVEWVNNL